MTYRISLRSNPRILLLFLLVAALPAVGVLGLIFVDGLMRIIVPVVAFYLTYHLIRFISNHLKSFVDTSEEGLKCRTTVNEEISFAWDAISHAGCCNPAKGAPTLFVYDGAEDKLLTVPQEYGRWDELRDEIKARTDFHDIALTGAETLQDRLKALLEDTDQDA